MLHNIKTSKSILLLLCILILGSFFRLYNLNWDQGYHLHPDERAITMFTTPLQFPKTISEFFTSQSLWNPHFFAYGSFPLYLLKITGNIASIFNPQNTQYDQINLIGRYLSAFFDTGTLLVLFFLGKKLFNKTVGALASFFYCISVLPIQLSHFYAVDTLLTFFVLLTLYQLVRLYERPTLVKSMLVGFLFGAALATKVSAIVLLTSIGTALAVDFLLIFLKNPHHPHVWSPHVPKFLKRILYDSIFIIVITAITFMLFEPYAFIDFKTFWEQNMQQYQMTHYAFTFPYTLQYVGKIPYWYELKNIFLWGLGPLLTTLSFLGTLYVSFRSVVILVSEKRAHPESDSGQARMTIGSSRQARTIIILSFFWTYFFVVGGFAIGFMRYLLPLYPLFCLFGAFLSYQLFLMLKSYLLNHKSFFIILNSLFIILLLAWPFSFLHIYTKPNTRVLASEWINKNILPGKTIALEHWDDGLPLYGIEKYHVLTLPLYDPDTPQKWTGINKQLIQTDYIIIASNRLYTPLMKLTNCEKLPPGRCYKETAQYYKKLFAGTLGFKKVAEFSIFPSLEIACPPMLGFCRRGNWKLEIRDEIADESFTVYDHPKVIIFKRE